jgi:hypothetical protein
MRTATEVAPIIIITLLKIFGEVTNEQFLNISSLTLQINN